MNYSNDLKEKYKVVGWNIFGLQPKMYPTSSFNSLNNEVAKDILVAEGALPIVESYGSITPIRTYQNDSGVKTMSDGLVQNNDDAPVELVKYPTEPYDCPAGWIKDARGVCQPLNWSPMPTPTDVGTVKDKTTEPDACPAGWVKDARGVCQPLNWGAMPANTNPPPTKTNDTTTGGVKPAPTNSDSNKTTNEALPAPQDDKKPLDKKWWIIIGVGVLVLAVATTYFIAKS